MPDKILERLHATRRRLRIVQTITGCCRVIIALVVLVAAFFAVDFFITSHIFPTGTADLLARLVLLIAGAIVWLRIIYTDLWKPMTHRYTDDDIAMLVEKRHAELNARLISTVQLTQAGARDASRYQTSSQLIAALDEQTRATTSHVAFADFIDLQLLRRAALGAVILAVMATALALWRRHYFDVFIQRMALFSVNYPTSTRIVSFTKGGNLIAGQPLLIQVELDPHHYVPREAHVLVHPMNGAPYTITLDPVSHRANIFQGKISNTLARFTYRLRAYDAQTPWQTEHVWARPSVKALAITCVYPSYVQRPPHTTQSGDVIVPAGTVLNFSATLVYPCKEAAIKLRIQPARPKQRRLSSTQPRTRPKTPSIIRRTLPMILDANGLIAHGQWTATQNASFYVHLVDRHGLINSQPTRYIVEAVPDLPPVVHILFPRRTEDATPFAAWPIRYSASDDYGLTKVYLVYQIQPPSNDNATSESAATTESSGIAAERYGPAHKILIADLTKYQQRRLRNMKTILEFTGLKVTPGCRVRYWLEALDNHLPTPNMGKSHRLRFRIEDPAVLSARLARRNREALRALYKVKKRSQKTLTGINSLVGAPATQK